MVFLSVLYYSLVVITARIENNIFISDGFIRLWVKNAYGRLTRQKHCSMGTNARCVRQEKWCYEVTWWCSRYGYDRWCYRTKNANNWTFRIVLRDPLSCEINVPDSRPAPVRKLHVPNDRVFFILFTKLKSNLPFLLKTVSDVEDSYRICNIDKGSSVSSIRNILM
jgi:hypothetical protein